MEIHGFSAYDIDENGTVTIRATGEVVPWQKGGKYHYVYIWPDSGSKRQANVHVLVAEAFCGPKPPNGVVRFLDGDHDNICASNLAWSTRSEISKQNIIESMKNRKPKSNAQYRKACADMVYEALREYGEPITMVELANIMQQPYSIIRYAIYGLIAVGKADAVRGGYIAL